jgi:hypothetical protein
MALVDRSALTPDPSIVQRPIGLNAKTAVIRSGLTPPIPPPVAVPSNLIRRNKRLEPRP